LSFAIGGLIAGGPAGDAPPVMPVPPAPTVPGGSAFGVSPAVGVIIISCLTGVFFAVRLRRIFFLRRDERTLPPLVCDLPIGGLIIGGLIGELPSGRGASCADAMLTESSRHINSAPKDTLNMRRRGSLI
ncbi:MAG: hypothetical protein ICV68_14440, partial [Pyrinomonadaceae bacterium]|nr:hypothetical protein [Pyrinomonadaceae bacterium]